MKNIWIFAIINYSHCRKIALITRFTVTFYIPIESDYSQLYSRIRNFVLHRRIFILQPKKQTEVGKKRASAKILFNKILKI